jgi:zinc resistance-associated protein
MWKSVLAGTTALAIAGSALAYAQSPGAAQQSPGAGTQSLAAASQQPGAAAQSPAGPDRAQAGRPTAEDISALADARIAALKTGLKLTAEQETHWPALEQALREMHKERADRMAARRNEPRPGDMIERLRQRADAMTAAGTGLKRLADAAQPLYQTLDEGQKRRLTILLRAARSQRLAFEGGHHHRRMDRVQ